MWHHGETAHIDTIFKFLPHTRQHQLTRVWQELVYRIDVCRVTVVHTSNISRLKKNLVAVKNSIKVGLLVFLL